MAASAQDLRERGNAYYQRQQFSDAIACYDRAISLDASVASAHTNRAAANFALRRYPDALADADRAVRCDATWVKGHYRRGACLVAMERFEDAAEAYQRGADLDPSNAQIREGLKLARRLQLEQPKDAAEARLRGNGAYRDGKYEDARRWYSKGLKLLDREEEENARQKGVRQQATKDNSDALDDDAASSMDLEDPDAARRIAVHRATLLANRAECSRQSAEMSSCVADCDAALAALDAFAKAHPTQSQLPSEAAAARLKAHVRRGLALEYLEKADEAEAAFEAALETSATCAMAIEGLRRIRAFKNVEEDPAA
jgi:stress-induced-phosphoprotein 1